MELKQLTEKVFYIENQTNIGVIKCDENSVVLIDSGLDDDTGRRILNILSEKNLTPKALINTHSHADHCGANAFIQKRTSIPIYAAEFEAPIVEHPFLEPFYLFGGAQPPADLQNKFLMAQQAKVTHTITEKKLKIGDIEIEIVPLKGHGLNQIGILFEEILFCGDAIFSHEILSKYKIPLFTDWAEARNTLEFLSKKKYKFVVGAHQKPMESIEDLAKENLRVLGEIEKTAIEKLKEKKTTSEIIKELSDHFLLEVKNVSQYHLLASAINGCLSELKRNKKIDWKIEKNTLYWFGV